MKLPLKKIIIVVIGAFILMCPAIYNGYPILHSDSGTYIRCAFTNVVEIDRPIMYSLFIKYSSFKYSLWLTVFFQALLVAFVLEVLFSALLKNHKKYTICYLAAIAILTLFTGVGWYVAQIMPDILSAVLIICLSCLLFVRDLSVFKQITLCLIVVFCCTCHFSHQVISFIASGILLILITISLFKPNYLKVNLKKAFLIIGLSASSYLSVYIINYTHKGGFAYSKSSHAFLMAHFIESGIVKEFLFENCDRPEFKSCKTCLYKNNLETEIDYFLWDYSSSFYKIGGWDASREEYNFIISKMLSSQKYLLKNIYYSLKCGVKQLFRNDVGEGLFACGEFTAAGIELKKRFPHELNVYLKSKQNNEEIFKTFKTISVFNYIFIICGLLSFVICIFKSSSEATNQKVILISLVAMVIVNSFVTAGLSTVHDRFQARVSWLLVVPFIIFLVDKTTQYFNHKLENKPANHTKQTDLPI